MLRVKPSYQLLRSSFTVRFTQIKPTLTISSAKLSTVGQDLGVTYEIGHRTSESTTEHCMPRTRWIGTAPKKTARQSLAGAITCDTTFAHSTDQVVRMLRWKPYSSSTNAKDRRNKRLRRRHSRSEPWISVTRTCVVRGPVGMLNWESASKRVQELLGLAAGIQVL